MDNKVGHFKFTNHHYNDNQEQINFSQFGTLNSNFQKGTQRQCEHKCQGSSNINQTFFIKIY